MVRSNKFCASISGMDGRIQLPIIHWLKEKYNISYVDTITNYAADKLFSNKNNIREIKESVMLSINIHGSKLVVISGHYDCTENPIAKK